jgi:GH15 family glucan-1,4-alpha-glucosidase
VPQPSLDHYGLIGDLRTAALVRRDGSIDFCCAPRFDSPGVFSALLDDERGGRWRITPSGTWTSEQRYLAGTNVLETAFRVAGEGVVTITDFMAVGPRRGNRCRIFRRVFAVRSAMKVDIDFQPRFDFASVTTHVYRRRHGLLATDRDNDAVALSGPEGIEWRIEGGRACATIEISEGQDAWFVLAFDEDEVQALAEHQPADALEATTRWWDEWASKLVYEGPHRREVERSALALKLCCYEPTGAIVAAPTTSLPESPQGGRTWDYRFTWLRDSAFVLYALDELGAVEEAEAFFGFLRRVCRRVDAAHLQIMYGLHGERDLPERILDHLSGYRGIGPVRTGNGAANQFQMDVYGEVIDAVYIWSRRHDVPEGLWQAIETLVGWMCKHWRDPDYSIWEPRHHPRHHTFSKIMAWVAFDRASRMAEKRGAQRESDAWCREAELVKQDVLEHAWDEERRTFVQVYGEPQLDAALLVIPKVRFLPRGDPRVASTLAAIRKELGSPVEELVYRYRTTDGLEGDEGAFTICSFWMIQNVALTGDLETAERMFKNLLRRAEPLGLLAEEIDPATGEQLGNYPQGLSHAALINTAIILEKLRATGGRMSAAAVATD